MTTDIGKYLLVTQYVHCAVGNKVLNNIPFYNTVDPVMTTVGRWVGGGEIMLIVRHFRVKCVCTCVCACVRASLCECMYVCV